MSPRSSLRSGTFRSLRERNFRLFFVGSTLSMSGTWMQTLALSWLVLELSPGSGAVAIGVVIACQYLPTLFLGMYGGVIADAFDKRKVLAISQVVQALVATLLGLLTVTGVIELWMVFAIVAVNGFALVLDNPTRISMLSELVTPDELPNAIGLNGAITQSSRIVGPAIGGVLIVAVGTSLCFFINALSFVALLVALAMIRPAELHRHPPRGHAKGQLRAGAQYMWRRRDLRAALLAMAVIGTVSFNMSVVLPPMTKEVFDGNAVTLSWLMVSLSCGALVGALVFASRTKASPRMMVLTGTVFGVLQIFAALVPSLPAFFALIAVMGLVQTTFLASSNTIIQLRADAEIRGRVMAVYNLTIIGSMPIGGPIIGVVCQVLGPRWGFVVEAVGALVAMAVFGTMMLRALPREPAPFELSAVPDGDHVVVEPLPSTA